MLKIRIIAIGDHKDKWIAEGCEHYIKMLSRSATIEMVSLPSPKLSARMQPDEIRKAESARLLESAGKGMLIALSDNGKELDSLAFSASLEKWQTKSAGTITFLIGGPHGHHQDLLKQADLVLSLSRLTFSHQLVRLVLLEQLYRAFSILRGTDYHK